MKLIKLAGATSEIWQVFIQDSSKTDGSGLAGLTNASSGLTAYYHRDTDTTATAISLVTMTVGTFTSSGFKEIDATNMPGWYQFCPPNAALASGAKSCGFHLKGATNMAPLPIECQLTAANLDDATRLGLMALPNVASGSAGALPTTGTGANQIHVDGSGNVYAVSDQGLPLATFAEVANIAVTGAALNATAASVVGTTGTETGTVSNTFTLDGVFDSWADAAGTVDFYYQFNLSGTTGATAVGVTWDGYVVGVVNTVKVYAFNWGGSSWDQIGTIVGIAGTVVASQEWDLTSAHTGTGGNAGLVRIRFNATGLTSSSTKTDRILVGYAVVLTPPANWSSTLITGAGYTAVDGTSPMTESYSANGSGFTLAQALYEIAQNVGEFAISGTTYTVKKRDHSTTAEAYTLNSATTPTSKTRST